MKDFLLKIISGKSRDVLSNGFRSMLYFLSLIYSGVLFVRFFLYRFCILRASKYDIKVISVGNLTVGGTGKTPLVERITEYLLNKKKRVSIISRGYKGIHSDHGFIADEPQMLKSIFPEVQVIINKDRDAALKLAQGEGGCEVAVLDDALGNLKIKKDLEIVCINCLDPFGLGYVLPRGLLRLPFCYISNAQIFVLTHADLASEKVEDIVTRLRRYNTKAEIFKSAHVPELLYNIVNTERSELSSLNDAKVALLSAIAGPESFKKTVESLGARIVENFYFDDHHVFTDKELKTIIARSVELKVHSIITTAKDEPRIKAVMRNKHLGIEMRVLKIKLEVEENEGRFSKRIFALFAD